VKILLNLEEFHRALDDYIFCEEVGKNRRKHIKEHLTYVIVCNYIEK